MDDAQGLGISLYQIIWLTLLPVLKMKYYYSSTGDRRVIPYLKLHILINNKLHVSSSLYHQYIIIQLIGNLIVLLETYPIDSRLSKTPSTKLFSASDLQFAMLRHTALYCMLLLLDFDRNRTPLNMASSHRNIAMTFDLS